jgi:hypothetical protein
MRTVVTNIHRGETFDVYIGLPGPYRNPFIMHGESDRAAVCDKHVRWLQSMPRDQLVTYLRPLVGKRLGCTCKPKRCHGDNLVKAIYEVGLEEAPSEMAASG